MNKICIKCGKSKNELDFHFKNKKNNIRDNRCKQCEKIRHSNFKNNIVLQKTHKQCSRCKNIKAIDNFYKYNKNKDGYKIYCKDCHTDKYNLELRFHRRIKRRAKIKGIEYNLKKTDYKFPEYCPILSVKLNYYSSDFDKYSASVDRLDNSKGYIPGNIRIISRLANIMKNSATLEELTNFSKNILIYLKDNDIV